MCCFVAGSTGLNGDDFQKLVKAICFDFPEEHLQSILKVLQKKGDEILSFNEFVAGVRGCLLYGDFLRLSEELFA